MTIDGPAVGSTWQGEYLLQAALGDPARNVFRAQRKRDGQTVVVRLWPAEADAETEQFLESARAAAAVRHSALGEVEAFGHEDGYGYIVSEHLAGSQLDTWADQIGIPPLPDVIELMQRLIEGLAQAAGVGAIHTALHPRNVVMLDGAWAADRKPQPKLLDLGVPLVARSPEPDVFVAQFMAPEQLMALFEPSQPPLPATTISMNVYSCGALLYYLCTGGPPFRHADSAAVREAQAQGRLVLPSRINPQVSASLNAVIVQAMSFDPRQRFASLNALIDALGHVDLRSSSASGSRHSAVSAVPPLPSASPRRGGSGLLRSPALPPIPPRRPAPPPIPAAEEFELESVTAETGRLGPATQRPPSPWTGALALELESNESRADRISAPVGSFSSAPPPPLAISEGPSPGPTAHAVVATPVALFSSSPNMRVEPALIVTRVDPTDAQLVRTRDVIASRPTRRFAAARFTLLYGSLTALVCFATYGVVQLLQGGSASAPSPALGKVSAARPEPQAQPEVRGVTTPPATPPPSATAAVVPERSVAAASAVAPVAAASARREDVRGPRRPARGAASASREPQSSPPAARDVSFAEVAALLPATEHPPEPPPAPSAAPAEPVAAAAPAAASTRANARVEAEPARVISAKAPAPARDVSSVAGPAKLAARVTIGEIGVRGSLPNSQVRRSLERIRSQLASCYARAAQAAGQNQFGALDVEVELDERGRARRPQARGSSLSGLNVCVADAAGKVVSEPPDTGTVRATFKVVYSP